MRFFSTLFKPKEEKYAPAQEKRTDEISCILLYQEIPRFNATSLSQRLDEVFEEETVSVSGHSNAQGTLLFVTLGQESLMLRGIPVPYPAALLDRILPDCHFDALSKEVFYQNTAHILLSYQGATLPPHARFNRLYQSIECLIAEDDRAIGVVHEAAHTAHPISVLDTIRQERFQLFTRKIMPFISWICWTGGYARRLTTPENTWFVTKGNHLFGLPELAFKGQDNQAAFALHTFHKLFAYLYFYKARLAVQHTVDMGDVQLIFEPVTEHKEILEGKYGTLVFRTL